MNCNIISRILSYENFTMIKYTCRQQGSASNSVHVLKSKHTWEVLHAENYNTENTKQHFHENKTERTRLYMYISIHTF